MVRAEVFAASALHVLRAAARPRDQLRVAHEARHPTAAVDPGRRRSETEAAGPLPGVQEGRGVSEREQAQLLKLLNEWLERFGRELPPAFMTDQQRETYETTLKFLDLDGPTEAESHGQRRG